MLMKLVCINAKDIPNLTGKGNPHKGTGLIKGEIYTSTGIEHPHEKISVYLIEGVGKRLTQRFREVNNDGIDELIENIFNKETEVIEK